MTRAKNEYNEPLIQVLRNGLLREQNKISRAEMEIINIKMQLLNLCEELPGDEWKETQR